MGLVLAFWLAGVATGAAAGGRLVGRPGRPGRPLAVFATAGLAMPACLAAVVVLMRGARLILGVGPGEYVGPGAMVLVSLLATVPVSLWIGLAFPAASALLGDAPAAGATGAASGGAGAAGPHAAKARAVGWVYLAESAGGLVGGVLFSFILV
ncbi:MAG: hypothetical protein IMZ66_05250, partial [Planctomycetes bacterium]|nr:hypothetical protein [Planctomycetota bacterium]